MTTIGQICELVVEWCELGFAQRTPHFYKSIAERLREIREPWGERVEQMIRLAEGGNELASPRFTYPHIQSIAMDILTEKERAEAEEEAFMQSVGKRKEHH